MTQIRELERGAKTPSMKMFVEIANKLEVTADDLLCDSVEKDMSMVSNDLANRIKKCSPEKMKIINVLVDAVVEKNVNKPILVKKFVENTNFCRFVNDVLQKFSKNFTVL